jgi:hypothetical protein
MFLFIEDQVSRIRQTAHVGDRPGRSSIAGAADAW